MVSLARAVPPNSLPHAAYPLYERFRPAWRGWGQPGTLDTGEILNLAEQEQARTPAGDDQ